MITLRLYGIASFYGIASKGVDGDRELLSAFDARLRGADLSGLIDTIERYGFPPETKNAFQEGRNVNIGSIPVAEIQDLPQAVLLRVRP